MSAQPADPWAGCIPEWDLADHLRKALRVADIGAQEMADYLEVSRTTISNYINGHTRPTGPILRIWALRCDVPFEWLDNARKAGAG
jgi:transcriptional regulator with XRE-family HTH domain